MEVRPSSVIGSVRTLMTGRTGSGTYLATWSRYGESMSI